MELGRLAWWLGAHTALPEESGGLQTPVTPALGALHALCWLPQALHSDAQTHTQTINSAPGRVLLALPARHRHHQDTRGSSEEPGNLTLSSSLLAKAGLLKATQQAADLEYHTYVSGCGPGRAGHTGRLTQQCQATYMCCPATLHLRLDKPRVRETSKPRTIEPPRRGPARSSSRPLYYERSQSPSRV